MIFFSAHGVPLAYVEEAGDPYKAEMEECVDLIMEELERRKFYNSFTLAYQVMVVSGFASINSLSFQVFLFFKACCLVIFWGEGRVVGNGQRLLLHNARYAYQFLTKSVLSVLS